MTMVLAKDSSVFIHVIITVAHPLTPISYKFFFLIDSHFTVTITVFELWWHIKQSIRVFWLNIAKNWVFFVIWVLSKLFGTLRKKSEFRQWCYRKRQKVWERKVWISIISLPKFLLLEITVQLPGEVPEGEWLKGNQLWLPSCRNCRGVRREKIGIVATKLLKMGGGKKKKNCGNQLAEILGRNLKKNCGNWFVTMALPKWREKNLWLICGILYN